MSNEILDDFRPEKTPSLYRPYIIIVFQIIGVLVLSFLSAYQSYQTTNYTKLFQHSILIILGNLVGWNFLVLLIFSEIGKIVQKITNYHENKLDKLSYWTFSLISAILCFLGFLLFA